MTEERPNDTLPYTCTPAAATVGIVSAPPVMNRNSATAAAPVKIFPVRKNPATVMKAHIATNQKRY